MSWVESELATVYRVGRRRYFSLDNAYIRQAKDLMLDAFSDGEGCQCYMDEVCEYHALLGVPGEAGIGASAVVLARSMRAADAGRIAPAVTQRPEAVIRYCQNPRCPHPPEDAMRGLNRDALYCSRKCRQMVWYDRRTPRKDTK